MIMTIALEVLALITIFVMIVDMVHELCVAKPRRLKISRKMFAR